MRAFVVWLFDLSDAPFSLKKKKRNSGERERKPKLPALGTENSLLFKGAGASGAQSPTLPLTATLERSTSPGLSFPPAKWGY